MTWQLLHGDARHISGLLEPESVDLIVTSPPYFGLRSYRDGGEHFDGQLGSEPTPGEFVDALIDCTRDWLRVLKPTGSLFVNLGDKYAGSGGHNNDSLGGSASSTLKHDGRKNPKPYGKYEQGVAAARRNAPDRYNQSSDGIRDKSLMGMPWRYAIRCVDELGLILRAEVIWSKPNGMPEPVTDRVRRSHEQFFHFTREGRYFAAIDEVREQAQQRPNLMTWDDRKLAGHPMRQGEQTWSVGAGYAENPLGKAPSSVWSIPSEPLKVPAYRIVQNGVHVAYPWTLGEAWTAMRRLGVANGRPSLRTLPDHFAAYPSELVRRIVLGWSPAGYCTVCDEPRRAVVDTSYRSSLRYESAHHGKTNTGRHANPSWGSSSDPPSTYTITGYVCACPTPDAPTRPAVVLDPFVGTGTTPAVAHHLGRHGIGVDLSRDYLRLAEWRCGHDTRLRNKVLDRTGIPNPKPPAINGQLDLLVEWTA